ncbi:MAG: hypothetical protein QOI46_3322, partial [Alphaproteobacteria bacterium]|nr:hypothetical protein [Alphaproteobacteria bacterium]
ASNGRQPSARYQVGTAHGIAIHCGSVEAWEIKTRVERCGNDTPCALGEGQGLGS